MSCLRKIKGVTIRDRVRNLDIREEVGVRVNVVKRIQEKRLRYCGHVVRMKPKTLHYLATYMELEERVDHIKDGSTTSMKIWWK